MTNHASPTKPGTSPKDSFTPEQIELLQDLFSGRLLGKYGITTQGAIDVTRELEAELNPNHANSDEFSIGKMLRVLGDNLKQLEAKPITHYAQRMEGLVAHDLTPTCSALRVVAETLEQAEKHKEERDPQKRREIAGALKKIPGAVEYIVGQINSLSDQFVSTQRNFTSETEHLKLLHGNQIPDDHVEDMAFLSEKLGMIEKAYRNSKAPIYNFLSEQERISKLAQRLEKEFMQSPRPASEPQRG